ncbi:MAG: PQQ-dependent dehydrogenase, methanol/ethanol family [Novosphingobium sp.]|nr:PQQ-dependent dehydrogenase, methanol/ethanol family [Novosphingobium sp.]
MKRAGLIAVLALAGALAACKPASETSQTSPPTPKNYDWPHYGGQQDEAGYAALGQIDRENVKRLGLAWSLDLPDQQALEATPLAVDGVLYFTGTYSDVYAVSVETGKLLWRHEAKVFENNARKMNFIFPLNRGCAYADGKVFSATTDGRLLALDAKTGELLWSTETVERDDMRYVTGAPRAFKNLVMIGQGGGDTGSRGYVTAYDQKTGKQVWRFYTVPGSPEENKGDPAMEMAAKTWRGQYWKTGTGGTAWHGMTFDPELNQVYIGTGNSGPYDPEKRSPGGGDNLFLASIVAVDADTGEYKWHYQMNPREAWDYKATAGIVTANLTIDGKERKVLMQAPTNGFFYVIDRETGKLVNEPGKTGKVTWAERIDMETGRPVDAPNIRYQNGPVVIYPWTAGTHNWQAMSYSPRTGLVYIPYMQLGFKFTKAPDTFSGVLAEAIPPEDERDGKGALIAWDPVAQKARWTVWHKWIWNGGTLATGGDLVFQGTADGMLTAYDAENGNKLWSFNTGLGIIAPPISYTWKGTQYVSILVGWAGPNPYGNGIMPTGWRYNAQVRRLLTFKLDGKAKLPPSAPYDETVHPVDDPDLVIDAAAEKAGDTLYHMGCNGCHGGGLMSSGAPGPDLRESQLALDPDAMWQVLHEGALLSKGMPQFPNFTREQVNQIYTYIRAGAREELERQKNGDQGKGTEGSSRAISSG